MIKIRDQTAKNLNSDLEFMLPDVLSSKKDKTFFSLGCFQWILFSPVDSHILKFKLHASAKWLATRKKGHSDMLRKLLVGSDHPAVSAEADPKRHFPILCNFSVWGSIV